ncbi:MAG: hypothetical protein LBK06_03015 [Planctomycetaceae bacterium]|jgi:hypothetical protein|nr:hypothetical protein [Planctomycetaceae bacterium]
MKNRFFVSVCVLMNLLTFCFVLNLSVIGGEPIILYKDNFKAFKSSDFVKRLSKMPEWEPFVEAFTKDCDKKIERNLSRQKLSQIFPEQVVNDLRDFLESDISTRKAIDTVFQHLETVIFELHSDFDREEIDENLNDITEMLKGRKKDLEIDFDGLLAFIIDVNPRSGLSFLKYFRAGTDYKFIRNNEPDGDFILKFDFEFNDRDIEFCCTGVQLGGGLYAVIFADDEQIVQYYQSFKKGRYAGLNTKQPKKELIVEENCFLFIDKQLKRAKVYSNGTEFFGKIKKVKSILHDVDGVSQLEIIASMRTAGDSVAVYDLLVGLLAFVQLTFTEGSSENGLSQAIKVDTAAGNNVVVSVKLDDPEIWKLIAKCLKHATKKINEQQ